MSKVGAESYKVFVLTSTSINLGLKKMSKKDRKLLKATFNLVYYLGQLKCPFSDYSYLLNLHLRTKYIILDFTAFGHCPFYKNYTKLHFDENL